MVSAVEAEAATREQNNTALITAMREDIPSDAESAYCLEVVNDPERGRWIAALGAEAIGELGSRLVGGRVVLLSTWIDHAYRNQRVATELIAQVLDEIRSTGKKITVICPVVGEFIGRHPQYLGLIDKVHPGSGAFPGVPETSDDQELGAFENDLG